MNVEYRKMEQDRAAEEVLRSIDELHNRLDRDAAQIMLARNGEPCIVPHPAWVTQDAIKVTVALARFESARSAYGAALRGRWEMGMIQAMHGDSKEGE